MKNTVSVLVPHRPPVLGRSAGADIGPERPRRRATHRATHLGAPVVARARGHFVSASLRRRRQQDHPDPPDRAHVQEALRPGNPGGVPLHRHRKIHPRRAGRFRLRRPRSRRLAGTGRDEQRRTPRSKPDSCSTGNPASTVSAPPSTPISSALERPAGGDGLFAHVDVQPLPVGNHAVHRRRVAEQQHRRLLLRRHAGRGAPGPPGFHRPLGGQLPEAPSSGSSISTADPS